MRPPELKQIQYTVKHRVATVEFRYQRMRGTEEVESINRELNIVADMEDDRAMLINFSGVEFFSSRMISVLTALHTRLHHSGRKLALCRLRPEPLRSFRLCKMYTLIPVFDAEKEAFSALTASND